MAVRSFLKDPKALAEWYRDVLGLPLETWGGAALRYDAPKHPSLLVWNAFPASTKYFAPSMSAFMINYAVDDMDALLARLRAKHVSILKRDDKDPNGRFAWILDPEGNKIERWEPNCTERRSVADRIAGRKSNSALAAAPRSR